MKKFAILTQDDDYFLLEDMLDFGIGVGFPVYSRGPVFDAGV